MMTLTEMKREVEVAGFTASAGCWEDELKIVAFSVESCGPATMGHPRFMVQYCKTTGVLLRENEPYLRREVR